MRVRCLIFGLLLLSAGTSLGGELLDRMVANVNGHVILQSDWEDELRYESLMAGRQIESLSSANGKAALDRLIDQELIVEQMRASEIKPPAAEEINQHLEEIKADYVRDKNAEKWNTALSEYELTEDDIRNHIALELTQLRLVDAHLRPSIQIDAPAVADYYRNQFLPELTRSGAKQVSLQQATPKIREILTQQQMNRMLASWLEGLRSQAQIQTFASESPKRQGPTQ
jgi:peptidyl-prolyl cis-trans isomerase SurA